MEGLSRQEDLNLKNRDIQEGTVRLVQYDLILNDYALWVDLEDKKIIIPRQELEVFEFKGNLNTFISKKIRFHFIDYDEKRQIYIGSCKILKLQKRKKLIQRLKSGEIFDAKITRFVYFGAYLIVDDVSVIMRNRDFAKDYTTIGDIHREGDILQVKLLKISQNGKINIQAIEKYESAEVMAFDDFKPQTVVHGVVRTIKPWACFVNIAPNIDAICPLPNHLSIKEGMSVAFRINQVRSEEGRIRGKIIKIIQKTI